MGWAAAIQGAVGLGEAWLGHKSASKAADATKDASNASLDWIKNVYGNSQGNLNPYIQGGQSGLSNLLAGNYQQSPGYEYAKQEMMSGLNADHAARGSLYSGGTDIDRMRHLNGLAAQDYNNWWQQQMGLASLGAQSATALGGIGSGTFNGVQNAYGGIADAAAQKAGANSNLYGQVGGILGNGLTGLLGSSYKTPSSSGTQNWSGNPYAP
jgi:hypothetical protein